MGTLAEFSAQNAVSAKTSNNSEYNYGVIYAGIKANVINPETMNLRSYNNIFSEIKKMSLSEYLDKKSTSDYKKKIRRFFQLLGGKNISSLENKKLVSEYFALVNAELKGVTPEIAKAQSAKLNQK